MTTRVPIRYGGTGANTAASARTALGVAPSVAYDQANNAYAQANNARAQANTARNTANAAYDAANTKLSASGGTVSGDLIVSGNLTISGNSTTLNTETLIVEDAEIVLLSNVTASPVLNSGLIVNRGSSTNTFLRWNENTDKWGWSDDGTTFYSLDTALAAYGQANTARTQANNAYAQANLAYDAANNAAVKVTANSGATISSNTISFNNTATVSVSVEQNGQNANISFIAAPQTVVVDTYTAAGNTTAAATANIANGLYALVTDAANTVRVSQNGISTLSAKQLNLVNTSSVFIRVDDAGNGNANISFSAPGTNTYIRSEVFTSPNGDGNLVYTLNAYPFRESYVLVNKNGVALVPNTDFSLSNNLLTVIETGETGDTIDIRYWVDASTLSSNSTTIFIQANTPVSQTSTFTLAHNVTAINLVTVTKNGLRLTPNSHYTLSGNTITLTSPAEANDEVLFEYFYDLGTLQYKLGFIRNSFVGDGSTQSFVLDTAPSNEDNCLVFVDRVLQRNSEYDVTATTLTFTGAPDLNAVIDVFITTQLTANNGVIKTGDTMTGNLNVAATLITQNVEPAANITYNLGTNTKRFKDIYLSNSTIYLGSSTISAESGNITFGGANVQLSNVSAKLNVANDMFVSGNVGIGTTNPSTLASKAQIHGRLNIVSNNSYGFAHYNTSDIDNQYLISQHKVTGDGFLLTVGKNGNLTSPYLAFGTADTERVRIDSSGNVGIGTTNPSAKLQVSDSSTPHIRSHYSGSAAAGNKGALIFTHNRNSDGTQEILGYIQGVAEDNQSAGGIRFISRNNTDVEALRIISSGNVGIGVTAPSVTFNVGDKDHGIGIAYRGASSLPSIAGLFTDNTTGQGGYGSLLIKARTDYGGFYSINFYTAAADNTPVERVRIKSDGNVGIGTTNPSSALHVVGAIRTTNDATVRAAYFRASSANDGNILQFEENDGTQIWEIVGRGYGAAQPFYIYKTYGTGAGLKYIIDSSGNHTFNGNMTVSGTITESSSQTIKENINPITSALDSVSRLMGVTYDRKDGSAKQRAGLIAEEVEQILPNVVQKDENGNPTGIQYTNLIAYLIESIKELKSEIDTLKAK